MLNAIQFPLFDSPVWWFADNNVWKMIPVLDQVFFSTKFSSDAFKITSKFTPQCNTLFVTNLRYRHRFWCRGQSMKQFRPGYFKTYQLLKKKPVEILECYALPDSLTFARVLRYGKQIRVQFCCENFLIRHLLTLKHSHHFNFCLEFHDPYLLCSDGFTLIKFKLSCCDHFIFSFSSYYYMKLHSSFFIFVAYFICFGHISFWLSPSLLFDSVSSYSKSSSAFNSLCLSRFSYWWSMHLCCLFIFFSFPIERVTMFLAWCHEWPNTLWMYQLWLNC